MASDGEPYSGAIGAFPYAFRNSESWLLRSYVVLGGVLAALLVVLFGVALVVAIARTAGVGGGTTTFSRAFFLTVGFAVVAPLLAPVLLVARRHRRTGSDRRYDGALAASGYFFVASLYLAVVVSAPASQRTSVSGPLAVVIQGLYGLPRLAGIPILVLAAALIAAVHWRLG